MSVLAQNIPLCMLILELELLYIMLVEDVTYPIP